MKSLDELIEQQLPEFLPGQLRRRLDVEGETPSLAEISSSLVRLRRRMSAYIPSYLSTNIATDPVPGHCSINRIYGTLLFADVSGFTAMSEELSVLGKEGAEEITLVINEFFDRMVGISLAHAGDLIKFGGDALINIFSGDNAAYKALHTGIEMQSAMAEFEQVETSRGKFKLLMSIGIATGWTSMLSIGTAEKMDYMAAGKVLERLDEAESIAQSGQIVIDSETYSQLELSGDHSEVVPGYWLLDQTMDVPIEHFPDSGPRKSRKTQGGDSVEEVAKTLIGIKALKPYIPSVLFSHLVHNPNGDYYQGSHRLVSVLFAHFYGLDEVIEKFGEDRPDLILKIFNIYYRSMEELIYRHGGVISRVDSYKSGHRILALFGALRAHENDHQRAVLTAWRMQEHLDNVNLEIREIIEDETNLNTTIRQRIGVNSGFVFAGDVGATSRREFTVMGDQVNLTARLMSASGEGEILIGESTVPHLESNVILEEKPSIRVKGKSVAVRSYSLINFLEKESSFAESTIPFAGREIELKMAKDCLDLILQGHFATLIVRGDSGIGKTRFMQEVISNSEDLGINVLSSYSQSFNRSMPYSAWLKIFNYLFGINAQNDQDETYTGDLVRETLREIDAEAWAPLFGSVLGLNIPESQMTSILDAKFRQQKIFDLTLELLGQLAAVKPQVVLMDDLQWADPVSLQLVDYLINSDLNVPILLMIAHRTDDRMPEWSENSGVTDIGLTELPDHASIQIAKSVADKVVLPDTVIEFVLEKSSGNPLFIQEIMLTILDEEGFQFDEVGFLLTADKLREIEIPDSIHGLVISRIDRLPIELRFLLQRASINGVEFSLDFLQGAFGMEESKKETESSINSLVETGVIEQLDEGPSAFRFQQFATRDVVYDSIPYRDRRKMHIQYGGFLEENPELVGGERIDLLAYHFYEGQSWDKAVEYNLLAGERAKTMFANESAIEAYQKVVEAISVGDITEDLLATICSAKESLGEVYTLVGRYDNALENFSFAFENLCGEEDEFRMHLRQADLCRKIADVYERQSELEDAFNWIDTGLEVVGQDVPTVERAKLYLLGAGVYHRKGDNHLAAEWCDGSISITENLTTDDAIQARAQAYYLRGAIDLRTGNLSKAVESCEKSRQLYLDIQDVLGEARAYNNLGIALTDLGQWDQATEALEKSLAINQQIGNIHEEGFGANNLGNIYLYKGDWERALQLFQQSNKIWKRIGALLPDAVTLSNQAQAHIYLEDWDEASSLMDQANELFTQVGSDDFTPELERRLGELKFKTGKVDEALIHLEKSLEVAEEQNAKLEIGLTARVLGEVHLATKELDLAEAFIRRSIKTLDEIESDHEAARSLIPLAELLVMIGETADAREHLSRAIESFKQKGIESDLKVAESLLQSINY